MESLKSMNKQCKSTDEPTKNAAIENNVTDGKKYCVPVQ